MSGRPAAADVVHCKGVRLLTEKLQSFLETMQAAFIEGRIQDVLACYTFPLIVYSPVGVTLIRNEKQFGEMATLYREAILALDVTSFEILIEQMDQPYNHRVRATARSIDFNADGTPVTGSLVRYFLVEVGDSFHIEMLEYLELPLSISDVERIVH
jgi:hypothetical protein